MKNFVGHTWICTILAGLSLAIPIDAIGASNYEACKVMTAKLRAASRILYWDFSTGWDWGLIRKDRVDAAETVVGMAYSISQAELDKKWSGFYSWSVLQVLEAWDANRSPDDLQSDAFQSCLTRWPD